VRVTTLLVVGLVALAGCGGKPTPKPSGFRPPEVRPPSRLPVPVAPPIGEQGDDVSRAVEQLRQARSADDADRALETLAGGDALERALRSAFCEAVTEYVNEGELPSEGEWGAWVFREMTERVVGFSAFVIWDKSQEVAGVLELAQTSPALAARYVDVCLRHF
jgi:hypothetical protein